MCMILLSYLIYVAFVGVDPDTGIFEIRVMLVSKLLYYRYFSTQLVITILNSDACRTICEMDVTCDLLC